MINGEEETIEDRALVEGTIANYLKKYTGGQTICRVTMKLMSR